MSSPNCYSFEPGTTASTIGTSFEITDLVNDGITADANGTSTPYVAGFNQVRISSLGQHGQLD
jgi:hypothetical protein